MEGVSTWIEWAEGYCWLAFYLLVSGEEVATYVPWGRGYVVIRPQDFWLWFGTSSSDAIHIAATIAKPIINGIYGYPE